MVSSAPMLVRVRFTVEENYRGWRLDRYLQEKIRRLSRAQIQRLIAERLEVEGDDGRPAAGVLQPVLDEVLDLGARQPPDLLLQVTVEAPAPVVLLDGEADAHLHRRNITQGRR